MAMTPTTTRTAGAGQLDIRDLRLVLSVAAEGTLTGAVARLNVTQPALSRHLASLEARLGAQLFARTGQRMRLTPAGELFVRHAAPVLDDLEHMETQLSAVGEAPERVLRIATECYTGYHWLPAVLNRFAAKHPSVAIKIAYEAVARPMHLLRAGAIDVALLTHGPRRGVVCTPLFDDETVAVVAPGHPWATRPYVDVNEFANVCLFLMSAPENSSFVKLVLTPARVRPKEIADVQLIGALAALSEAGFGVGVAPSWMLAPEIKSGRLVAVRIGRRGCKRRWLAAVSRTRVRDKLIADFVGALGQGQVAIR
jgi:LysR family transcriptional regulator for metE and metH